MNASASEDLVTLRETATLFGALFERSGVGIALIDTATGRILRANAVLCELLGRSDEEVCELDVWSITHPDDLTQTRHTFERLLRAEKSGFQREKRLRRADGSYVWVLITVTPLGSPIDEGRQHIVVLHDITERKHAELALRESEMRFRSIFEQASVGVVEIDVSTRCVLRVNPRLCEILGYAEQELVGVDFLAATHSDDVEACLRRYQRLSSGELGAYRMERRYTRKDGSLVWADVSISPLEEPSAGHARVMAIVDSGCRPGSAGSRRVSGGGAGTRHLATALRS